MAQLDYFSRKCYMSRVGPCLHSQKTFTLKVLALVIDVHRVRYPMEV